MCVPVGIYKGVYVPQRLGAPTPSHAYWGPFGPLQDENILDTAKVSLQT